MLTTISARSAPLAKPSVNNVRLCPQDYSTLRLRQVDATLENDNDDADESRESICEQAMHIIVQHHNIDNLNPAILLAYCPHLKERLAAIMEKNDIASNANKGLNLNDLDTGNSDDSDDQKKRTIRK